MDCREPLNKRKLKAFLIPEKGSQEPWDVLIPVPDFHTPDQLTGLRRGEKSVSMHLCCALSEHEELSGGKSVLQGGRRHCLLCSLAWQSGAVSA